MPDHYFVYGPANPWILAKLWQLFGPTILIGRLYGIVIQAGIVACCFHLLRGRVTGSIRLFACLACLCWLGAMQQNHLYPASPCLLLSLIAGVALLRRDPLRPTATALLVAGGCAGLATLFRYDTGVAIGASLGVYLVLLAVLVDRSAGRSAATVRSLALLGLGFAVLVVPSILFYWQAGAIPAWWHDIIAASTSFYISHRGLPFPALLETARRPSLAGAYMPLVALVIAAATARAHTAARPFEAKHVDRLAAGLLMACLAAGMYYKGIVRVQPLHFVISLVPATLLLAICAAAWWQRGGRGRIATAAIALLALLPPAHAVGVAAKRSLSEPDRLMAIWLFGRHAPVGASGDRALDARLAGVKLAPEQIAASAFVRRHSRADEPVLVAVTRHDRFVINNVALYFAMDRTPATRWSTYDPGLQTRADIQQAIIRDLTANHARWIVRDAANDGVREPNASSVSSGVTILDQWIACRFRVVRRYGATTVLLRQAGAAC